MSHQIYFVHTELDILGFINIIYGKGGVLLSEKGLLWDKENAADTVTRKMFERYSDLSILAAEAAEIPNAAVISLTLPVSREPRKYVAGRLYFPPDRSSGVYDPACLKLFQRIKTGIRKSYHYLPGAGHYMSDRLLMGCLEGKWSAVYFHGTPIPISDWK